MVIYVWNRCILILEYRSHPMVHSSKLVSVWLIKPKRHSFYFARSTPEIMSHCPLNCFRLWSCRLYPTVAKFGDSTKSMWNQPSHCIRYSPMRNPKHQTLQIHSWCQQTCHKWCCKRWTWAIPSFNIHYIPKSALLPTHNISQLTQPCVSYMYQTGILV